MNKPKKHGKKQIKQMMLIAMMPPVLSPPLPLLFSDIWIFEFAAAAARKGTFWLYGVIGGLIAGLDIGGLKG